MQPKFTQKKWGFVCLRVFAMALIFTLTSQISFAQQKRQHISKVTPQQQAEKERQKLQAANAGNQSRIVSSLGPAPAQSFRTENTDNFIDAANPLSRAFNYNSPSAGAFQFNAQNLLSTALTPRGATVAFGFPGAMAWNTVTNVLYVVDQAAPYALYRVDTLTGVRTFVVNCTGVPQANLTGITWDPITNTMYGVSSTITVSQIFTLNITTGVCTPIGVPTAVVAGAIMINAAPGGSLFSVDIVADNLYKWNKTTGVPTLVGSLGINTNFGQDGHFDLSDGQLYWATINAGAGNAAQLRVIDTTNGSSTLIGTYPGQVATLGIYSIPLIPCAGTPNPGNTESSTPTSCPGIPFTLSLSNLITTSGNSYIWQSAASITGPTWTTIAGATNPTYTTTNAGLAYRAIVTCINGGATGTSTPIFVGVTAPSSCYCTTSTATSTADEDIFNVTLGTLNNTSTCASVGPGPGSVNRLYANYTSGTGAPAAPNVQAGLGNPFSVTIGTCNGNWANATAIWIDADKSGTFELSEKVYAGPSITGPHTETGNLVIPGSALGGITRMRVVCTEFGNSATMLPCATYTWGETEDYNVNIIPCVPITVLGTLPNTTIQCSGSTSYTITANGTIATYQWEYRATPTSPWQFVTNGGIYSGATTGTLTLTNVSQAFNGYQYRAVVTGGCSGVEFSNISTLTVGPIIATVTPTSATICVGSIQQLNLTNASSPTTVTFNNNTPLAIPDNSPAGVYSTIAVSGIPAGAIITNVSIRVNISHTFVGDLENNIIAPNGVSLNLMGELDGGTGSNGSDDFLNTIVSSTSTTPLSGAPAPRTGIFGADRLNGYGPSGNFQTQPNGMPWSALYSVMNGNWRLGLSDWFALDAGTLNNWSISITYGAPATGVWTAAPGTTNTMFTDALATVPYVAGSQATSIYVQPSVNTVYSVVYSTATPCTSAPTNIPVTVVTPAAISTNPVNTAACVGGSTSFSGAATGGPVTYQWQVSTDGGLTYTNIAGATSATYTLTNIAASMTGYRYRLLASAAPCAGSATSTAAVLTVNPLPNVTLSSPDLLLAPGQLTSITATSSTTPVANSWRWTLNGVSISNPTVIPPVNVTNTISNIGIDQIGTYRATVTDINGCTATSGSITIGSEPSDNLWIYPNPTSGQFQVRLFYDPTATAERRVVYIYNSDGQLMTSREFNLLNTTAPYMRMDFDLGRFAKGTYVVKVVDITTGKTKSGLVLVQ